MKRKLITPILIVLLAGGGFLATQALADRDHGRHGWEDRDHQEMKHDRGGNRYERLAEVLGLSDQQREQIRAIIKTSRETAEPLRQQLRENRQALREASEAASFDEAKIRSLATAGGNLQAELAIHRAQTRQQLRAQLTPEQQALYDKVKPLLAKRHDGKRHHRYERFDDDDHHGPRFRGADPS